MTKQEWVDAFVSPELDVKFVTDFPFIVNGTKELVMVWEQLGSQSFQRRSLRTVANYLVNK